MATGLAVGSIQIAICTLKKEESVSSVGSSYTGDLADGTVGDATAGRPDHLNDLIDAAKPATGKGARPKVLKSSKQSKKQEKQPAVQNQVSLQKEVTRKKGDSENTQVQEIQMQLDQFMMDEKVDMLEFPTTLTSHDRFLVHELSEKLGLGHTSKGTGEDRYIVVTRPSVKKVTLAEPKTNSNIVESKISSKSESNLMTKEPTTKGSDGTGGDNIVKKDSPRKTENRLDAFESPANTDAKTGNDGMVQCKVCGKNVIKANIVLHEIHCTKKQTQDISNKNNDVKKKSISNSSKPRQFDKELAKKIEHIGDDDLDALLETVKKVDSVCCFKKCKKSVQTLCDVCKFCEGRYCMSHHMPEVHGCGEAAREAARARISKEGVLYRGSGAPNKKPDEAKKAHLQRKLDSKLSDMASKRKSKPKK